MLPINDHNTDLPTINVNIFSIVVATDVVITNFDCSMSTIFQQTNLYSNADKCIIDFGIFSSGKSRIREEDRVKTLANYVIYIPKRFSCIRKCK